jgi:hypothetical protein
MSCPECGFRFDPDNESQVVCPGCGAGPASSLADEGAELAVAFEDGEAFAEAPVTLAQVLGWDAPMEPEIDYVPDPELELAIADGAALMQALTELPILVAGNSLIN